MEIGLFTIEEMGIRFPQSFQYIYADSQNLPLSAKSQSVVHPALPEVQVNLVCLRSQKE